MSINTIKLQQYVNAYVKYEMKEHGVDPRISLDGTTFRIEKKHEGYKYKIYDKYHALLEQGPPYVEKIIASLDGNNNLVDYRKKNVLSELFEKKGKDGFEAALTILYEDDNDELAFQLIVDAIGGKFDLLGYLFFLKNKDRYLPLRPQRFDTYLSMLGVDPNLNMNCSWEKYMEFISWVKEVQTYLIDNLNPDITLLDAHSFVWIVSDLKLYLTEEYQFVQNEKNGIGVIIERTDDHVVVRYGKKDVMYLPNVFETGILKEVPLDLGEERKLSAKEVEVVKAILKLVANRKRVITYGELSDMTDSKPSPYYEMNKILDNINRYCDKLGLPHISAMVVNKETGLPGEGFKNVCVKYFGYDENLSTKEIAEQELNKIGKCDAWDTLANSVGIEMPTEDPDSDFPEELSDDNANPIIEGAKKQITVNAYERDPKAKILCKNHYMHLEGKIRCQVCGFDFGNYYGAEYANKIHIHHIRPISEIGEEYVVDPVKDLIPVCPNCHLVLHTNGGISVEELRKKVKRKDNLEDMN